MNKRRPESPQAASLREQAEKAFREMLDSSLENLDALSPETLFASLHELRVHQIELEMQNEDLRRAKEELDTSRARYFDLYDLAPVGYCTVDEKGLILEANLTATALLRVERGALVGRGLSDFISKEGQDLYYLCRKNLLNARQPQECDLPMVRHDGTAFFAHLNFTVARAENGEPVCRVALVDVTAGKRTEEKIMRQDALINSLLDSIPDIVFFKNLEGACLGCNTAFAEFMGRPKNEIVGKAGHELFDKQVADIFQEQDRQMMAGRKPRHNEEWVTYPDGRKALMDTMKTPYWGADGELIGLLGISRDITERKMVEKELKTARDVAESAVQAKSEFLATMTHELRNPLCGILGFAELLADTTHDDKQQSFIEAIRDSGNHLLSLINDVLDFSSIEKGSLTIHSASFDLARLVKAASDSVRKSADDKGIAFHYDVAATVPEQITGDERRIRQILINLLANAVRFTSDGSVSLRVTRFRKFLDFSVKDTGIGISSEALARLFQLFTQADSTINQKYGGTGIGLAISQCLAEDMGGSISVISVPGKGSTFTFRLPLEAPAGGIASAPSHLLTGTDVASPSSPCAKTPARTALLPVLVVEDDRSNSLMVGKMLTSLGYHVEFVTSGAEAIEAFLPGKYSAILMDLRMPVMDGLVATEKIREIELVTGYHVPIIAFTAQAMRGARGRCLAAGMDDFLSKPFKKKELAAKLACVFRQECHHSG
ncbi:MAG: ATP-binding protein [Verrucomicrobiota bacterium]